MDFTRSTAYCFPSNSDDSTVHDYLKLVHLQKLKLFLIIAILAETGVREQFNIDTAYVDASQVYGSDNERAKHLREFKGGSVSNAFWGL